MPEAAPGPDPLPVCIVGAGSSGVTMAKALLEAGVAFDCPDLDASIISEQPGGWAFRPSLHEHVASPDGG